MLYNDGIDTVSILLMHSGDEEMIKGTPELIAQRREEIVNACEALYRTMSFKDITLKEIGGATSFSRPTIYNYFETREEIFLALFQREYERWNADLEAILSREGPLTRGQLADELARSLEKREQLLKLLSMNNYDMEKSSRQELLTAFKTAYGRSMENLRAILRRFCPDMSQGEIERFIYIFYPFMFGIYPYTSVTEKQRRAMQAAGVDFASQSVYGLTRACLLRLLGE